MNYYDVLGLQIDASPTDITKAYRNLAKEFHPDKGGNEQRFHEISEAYDVLKDPNKRAKFDYSNSKIKGDVFDDMFTVFGTTGFHPSKREYHRAKVNKNLGIVVECSLEETLDKQNKTVSIKHTNGTRHLVNLKIPRSVNNGTKIKYKKLGDTKYPNLPPGDLTVTIKILSNNQFTREGDNLKMHLTIDVWSAIIGTVSQIKTLDNKILNLNIPPSTQYGRILKIPNHGMYTKEGDRGNLLVQILVKIPENLSEQQLNICKKLRDD
tara:strand:- start:9238 stop:10035 length:798 start_codon:yes stop_codon:yes gene_type:complete